MARSSMLLGLIASLIAATQAQQPDQRVCKFDASKAVTPTQGLNFDVCNLASPAADYIWLDATDLLTYGSTFFFNIGMDAVNQQPDPSCAGKGSYAAYQVTHPASGSNSCYGLAKSLDSNPLVISQDVLDPKNPAKGWVLTYLSGDNAFCAPGQSRSFSVIFLCNNNNPFPAPGQSFNTFVNEVNQCQYQALSYSPAGCPTQCPRVNGQVCAGNGICGYDDAISAARCMCYDDWSGADCQSPSAAYQAANSFPSGSVAGATIGGILIGAAALLGVSYWKRQ